MLSLEANRDGSGKGPSPGGVGGKAALQHPQGDGQGHSTRAHIQKEMNPRGIKPKESESCVRGEELIGAALKMCARVYPSALHH